MAIQDSKGLLRGAVGDLVFRVVNGKQVVQQRVSNPKMSKKALKRAKLFGTCSKQTSIIRGRLKPWLGSNYDSKMIARFQGRCFTILNAKANSENNKGDLYSTDLSALKGFDFNSTSPVSKYLLKELRVEGELETGLRVLVPELETSVDLIFPRICEQLDLHIVALHIPKDQVASFSTYTKEWTLPRNQQIQQERVFLIPPIQTEGITLVIVQLLFSDNKSKFGKVYINDKKLHPMQVVFAY